MFIRLAFVLWAAAAAVMGQQLQFPDPVSTGSPFSSTTSTAPSAGVASHPGQTRFFGGLEEITKPITSFLTGGCSSCSPSPRACCSRGFSVCCSSFSGVGGGFNSGFGGHPGFTGHQGFGIPPGVHPGFVSTGVSPGFVAPGFGTSGFGGVGLGGLKQGVCPAVGVGGGFNRFGAHTHTQCLSECSSDTHCLGVKKCCQVGCSSICRTPAGFSGGVVGGGGPVIVPTSKPGFCPKKDFFSGIAGFLGLRSGAGASGDDPSGTVAFPTEEQARLQSRDDENERRISRRERTTREKRSAEPDRDDDREDRRNRRLNRLERIRNRVQRQAPTATAASQEPVRATREKRSAEPDRDDDREDRRNRRLNRLERIRNRVQRQAPTTTTAASHEPNTRFFLPCSDECFSDFDCQGSRKCCIDDKCKRCLLPQF